MNLLGDAGNIIAAERDAETGKDYYFYNKDIRSSTTSVLDSRGNCANSYEYSDFGETTVHGDLYNEICYTGGIYDANTGLYYLNARYYDPADKRFLTEDTYRGSENDPNTLHLYAYCANNPVNYVDPSGHKAEWRGFGVQADIGFASSGGISASFGIDLVYLRNNVKTRYKKGNVHVYSHGSASADTETFMQKMLESPKSLIDINELKKIFKSKKKLVVTLVFFGIFGDKKKFNSYEDFTGHSTTVALTINHATISMGMSSKGISVGMGLSSAKFGYSYGASYCSFRPGFTTLGRRVGNSILNIIQSRGMKNKKVPVENRRMHASTKRRF